MFSHIIIFGSSLPELLSGYSLCAIICGRVLKSQKPPEFHQIFTYIKQTSSQCDNGAFPTLACFGVRDIPAGSIL
jgi:hypothetical protein